MIRKNDSETYLNKWGKTITPKLNWHISKNSVYTNRRREKGKSKLKINLGIMYQDNWGYRAIGVHYIDKTNRYQKHKISSYTALKYIHKYFKKRNIPTKIRYLPEYIEFNSEKELKANEQVINNLANKYGFKAIINWEYTKYFPQVTFERMKDVYEYPFL